MHKITVMILLPIFYPLIAAAEWSVARKRRKRVDERKREGVKKREEWYARLPPPRSEIGVLDKTLLRDVSAQSQSSFFGKLPLELRLAVYEYAFSGQRLEFKVLDQYRPATKRLKLRCTEARKMMAFVQTCKLALKEVFSLKEVSDTIFAANEFYFFDTAAYLSFHRLLPTCYLHSIRSLTLLWSHPENPKLWTFTDGPPPGDDHSWKETCQKVAEMRDLKIVKIDMVMYRSWYDPAYVWYLLASVEVISETKDVTVRTSWPEGAESPWPFTVQGGAVEAL